MAEKISDPCIVVTPLRPKGMWWVLDTCGKFGFIEGNLQPEMARAFARWMRALCSLASQEGGIDAKRPRAFGFSAGAYALTEILAQDDMKPFIFRLALGGLHGHGQPDLDGLTGWRKSKYADICLDKFQDYLDRLSRHPGVPGGMTCFYHPDDAECPWKYGRIIANVLDRRQLQLGHAALRIVKVLGQDQLSHTATKWKKKGFESERTSLNHDYQDTAFLQSPFLKEFLQTGAPRGSNGTAGRSRTPRTRSRSWGRSGVLTLKPRSCDKHSSSRDAHDRYQVRVRSCSRDRCIRRGGVTLTAHR